LQFFLPRVTTRTCQVLVVTRGNVSATWQDNARVTNVIVLISI